jgi:Uma2 family endonuclease
MSCETNIERYNAVRGVAMSAPQKRKLTAIEYLEIERNAAFKSDFCNGEMFTRNGENPGHNRIMSNVIGEVGIRLRGGPFHTYSSDKRLKIVLSGNYIYPDIIVQSSPLVLDTLDPDSLTNPTAVIEILSPSTEQYDRNIKQINYRDIPTLKEIVLVFQAYRKIERYSRRDDGTWSWDVFNDPDGDFTFASVPVSIPLVDVYRGVEVK